MITLKFQMKAVDVNKGLGRNWIREFKSNDVRIPEGWVHAIEVDRKMVSFSFVKVSNAKIPSNSYILVTTKGTRDQALTHDGSFQSNCIYYVMPVMSVLRPQKEDDSKPLGRIEDYLFENAVAWYTENQKKQWMKEKKLSIH